MSQGVLLPSGIVPPLSPQQATVQSDQTQSTGTHKLSSALIFFILVNSILGSSLFYLPSLGMITSGAASIFAWIALFIIATLIMMYLSELVTMHPTSGGTYEFAKLAYGRFGSFFTGWLIWIAGNIGMALNVVAAAEYFIPETTGAAFILRMIFVALWVIVLNYMAFRGIDAGATMLLVFGIIASVVIVAMTLPSFISFPGLLDGKLEMPFDSSLLNPFFQHDGLSILAYLGISLLFISEAFLGFEAVSYMANEAKEPKKLHKVQITAIIVCGLIVTLYILSSIGTVSYKDYVTDARPFAVQALNTLGEKGQNFVVFGMYLVIVGAAATWPITGSRLLQAMARDKLFVQQLAVLHPKHKSPYRAVYFQTFMVFLFSWLIFRGYNVGWTNPYQVIYLIYLLLSLLMVSLVLLTVPVLRWKEANTERPYRAPFGTIGPIAIVALLVILITNWIIVEGSTASIIVQLAGSFVILGFPFYFLVEMFYNPKAIVQANEKLASLASLGEKVFFPLTIRNKLFKSMGDVRGKVLLEYGCSIGSLTKKIGEAMGSTGRIYATDISMSKVEMAIKRNKHLPHVQVHHHPHLHDFLLPLPEQVDEVLSVGMLSYMQKPQQILTSLGKYVKKGGKITFLDYDKFFYILPNVDWIQSDAQLIQLFRNAGFEVKVERKRGLLWQYIVITGVKG